MIVGTVAHASAQQAPKPIPTSHIERLLLREGIVLVKEFEYVAQLDFQGRRLKVDTLTVTSPSDPRLATRGLRIQVEDTISSPQRGAAAFLDVDKVAELSAALAYFSDLASRWEKQPTKTLREATFAVGEGFSTGLSEQTFFIAAGVVPRIAYYGSQKDLAQLRTQIDGALFLLKNR